MPHLSDLDHKRLLDQLERHEGRKLAAYRDSVGILTIGIGHNCQASPVSGVSKVGDTITPRQCWHLFEDDVEKVEAQVSDRLPWAQDLTPPRYAVIVNMAFNLGIAGLCKFKTTLSLVQNGEYAAASRAMLQSLWARQVKGRALTLAKQMETGIWAS